MVVLKYKVPKKHRKAIYDNKKTIYCEIVQTQEIENTNIVIYKVKMLNFKNYSNIFSSTELAKLNILDKIKLHFI